MAAATSIFSHTLDAGSPEIQWLLEKSNPAVRFRTLRDLLVRPPVDKDLVESQREITQWGEVRTIFDKMHPDGYWSAAGKHKTYGHALAYKGYITTPHVLHNLAELGLDRTHPQTHKAVNRYLDVLAQEHGFHSLASCIDGYMLRALYMLGYGTHPVVHRMVELVMVSQRWDNGYLCGNRSASQQKSCMRGTWQVLMAFADVPELRDSPVTAQLAHYFLERNLLYRGDDPEAVLRPEVTMTIFPFVHGRASLLEVLYALSKLGYGKNAATARAWEILEQKRTADGRYILDWTPATLFPTGRRGIADKWVTLYALLAQKQRHTAAPTSSNLHE